MPNAVALILGGGRGTRLAPSRTESQFDVAETFEEEWCL